MKIETTTDDRGKQHEITVDETRNEFLRIHLGEGVTLTIDTSYNQVYYHLREATDVLATVPLTDELGLTGILVFNYDYEKDTGRITGIEIIP
jgi:hypothetical protein